MFNPRRENVSPYIRLGGQLISALRGMNGKRLADTGKLTDLGVYKFAWGGKFVYSIAPAEILQTIGIDYVIAGTLTKRLPYTNKWRYTENSLRQEHSVPGAPGEIDAKSEFVRVDAYYCRGNDPTAMDPEGLGDAYPEIGDSSIGW